MKRSAATVELARLDDFVGIWATEGELVTGPSGAPVKIKATDTYEWLPGGYFLLHHYEATMPDGNLVGIEIIGYDRDSNSYPMYSFDSQGNKGIMEGRLETDTWLFAGEELRFTGGFHSDSKVFAGLWERRAADGLSWQPWMSVRLNKID